jgi:uncharacterized protein involved in cysteine biosynthesis
VGKVPLIGLIIPTVSFAAESGQMLMLGGIRLEFILFALTLLGVALFHHYTMLVSLAGLAAVVTSGFLDNIAAAVSLALFGVIASKQQDKYQRIVKDGPSSVQVEWKKIGVVGLILLMAVATNYLLDFPALGVWVAILFGALVVKTPWREINHALPGTISTGYLLSVTTATIPDFGLTSGWYDYPARIDADVNGHR